jgi:glycosyltransferase involved in cell wall biosynthesis
MTADVPNCVLHSTHADPRFLKLLNNNHIDARAVFSQGNTVKKLLTGLRTAFRCVREFPNALFIVWCHHLDSNRWLQLGLALVGARFVIVERLVPADSTGFRNSRLTIPIKRFVTKRARSVILIGNSQVEHYSRLFSIPPSRLQVIPNSRPVRHIMRQVSHHRQSPLLRQKLGLRVDAKVAVCVGRLCDQKGQSTIIEAVSTDIGPLADIQVVLVGEGEKCHELEEQAQKMVPGRVKFVGHCKDVIPYLAAADLFVLPSLAEGLPGALIEAMAAGLPCVATDIPGNCELIQHEQNGLLVPPKSPMVLAAAIMRMISDSDLASWMGMKAHEFVLREYDESKEKTCWNELFRSLDQCYR